MHHVTSRRISPAPPTPCHSPRRHNSVYTYSAGWKEQVSLHPPHTFYRAPWECADQLYHCLVRELQCCWPQDPPADSEHGCKDHRCPSPIHPRHFPCTMLQQNQQHREGPHPPLPQTLPALPSGRWYRSIRARSARLLNSFFPQAVRALNSDHPRPPPPPPPPQTPPTLPHHRKKKLWTFFVQFKCATHRWVGLYKPPVVTHSPLCTRHFS